MKTLAYLHLDLEHKAIKSFIPKLVTQARFYLIYLVTFLIILATVPQALAQRNLREGYIGADVEEVEEQLRELEFFYEAPDRFFERATDNAVRAFQLRYGLTVDGIVGPETRRQLRALLNPSRVPSVPSNTPEISERGNVIRRGSSREQIKQLQIALVTRGYYPSERIDGIYGPLTEGAVQEFQQDEGLRISGVADTATQKALGLLGDAPYVVVIPLRSQGTFVKVP